MSIKRDDRIPRSMIPLQRLRPGRAHGPGCGCWPSRREFLQVVGLGRGTVADGSPGAGCPAMAGPFEPSDFDRLVPPDKKLDRRVGEVALRPGESTRLPRRVAGADRDADRRPLRGAALPGRRRQALALGHLQPGRRTPTRPITPTRCSPGRRSSRASPCRSSAGRQDCDPHARSRGISPTSVSGASTRSAPSNIATAPADRGLARGVLAVHPPEHRRLEPARDDARRTGHRTRRASRSRSTLGGWLENAVCLDNRSARGRFPAQPDRACETGLLLARMLRGAAPEARRAGTAAGDRVRADLEGERTEDWTRRGRGLRQRPVRSGRGPGTRADPGGEVRGRRALRQHLDRQRRGRRRAS